MQLNLHRELPPAMRRHRSPQPILEWSRYYCSFTVLGRESALGLGFPRLLYVSPVLLIDLLSRTPRLPPSSLPSLLFFREGRKTDFIFLDHNSSHPVQRPTSNSDNVNGQRVLTTGMGVDGQVSTETCTAACFNHGFRLAGTEYSGYVAFSIPRPFDLEKS